ncbi:TPA: hypothetical protein SAN82_005198 [Pseudomonas putida]|nr:hypothetical protein [Pseudomonas putida]
MPIKRTLPLAVYLIAIELFYNAALSNEVIPIVELAASPALSISLSEGRKKYKISIPKQINEEIEGVYPDLHLQDLNGDKVYEIIATSDNHNGANRCSKVYSVNRTTYSLDNLELSNGPLCNYKLENDFLISSYKDGAIWKEDIYKIHNNKVRVFFADSCIGCGEVVRKKYNPDGSFDEYIVNDSDDFKKRSPIYVTISSARAAVFDYPGSPPKKGEYLTTGDKVMIMKIDESSQSNPWIKFKLEGQTTTEGWIECNDIESCSDL